jgi:FkbM family methyltransferase
MTALWGELSHIHQLLRRTDSVEVLYNTGQLATLQATGIAMHVSRFEHWAPNVRRRLAGLMALARRTVTAPFVIGRVSQEAAELRQQLDAAAATLANFAETRRQLEVATTTIAHLRRIEARYESMATDYEAMATDCGELRKQLDTAAATLANYAETRRQLEVATTTIAHLRRIEGHFETLAAADGQARSGVQAFVDELQGMLFEVRETTPQSRSAAVLVLGDQPVTDAIATLINLSEPAHGARPFQYVLPFLAPSASFPLPWPAHMAPLRIVDVGSQELDFESDIFAPLRHVAPVEAVGFDPFAPLSDAPDGAVEMQRPNGGIIRTYPHLLADGGMVTFHINRFDATSSTLPTNHALTRPFGLLDLALETVKTRELPSRRLDDALADVAPVDLLKVDVQGAAHTVLNHGRALLGRTLVCHVEAEFAPVYLGERLFADIDTLLREAGFGFVDFFSLGRQRYARFDDSPARAFHRGRTLWADCIYLRGLDTPEELTADQLFRQALIVHACYNKQDLAAELLGRSDALTGGVMRDAYVSSLVTEKSR